MSTVDDILFDKPKAAPRSAAKTYAPRDAAIRTAIAEETDPVAREWVIGVIANRAKASGKNFYDVVTEKGQFEPWARGTAQKVDPNSDDYKATAAKVADILDGKRDPSGGMTHFYAPEAQAELAKTDGRSPKADFDDGTGTRVGSTLFFKKGGAPAETGHDVDDLLFAEKPAAVDLSKSAAPGAGEVSYTKGPGSLDKGQTEVLGTFEKGGFIDRNAPVGSERNPRWMTEDTTEADVGPGEYYVTRSSKNAKPVLKRAPGGDDKSSFTEGVGRGVGDVVLSASRALPGSADSELQNRFTADQMLYDAQRKGDLKSGLGRFTGQVIGSAPLLAGGEAVIAPKLAAMAPGIAAASSPVVKGALLAGKGAVEGGAAAALTSSASDAPIGDQVGAGMVGGGILGPLTPAARFVGRQTGKAVRSFVEPLTEKGRDKIANRVVGEFAQGPVTADAAELVPGSVPTLGQASNNAGIAALERNARTNPRLSQRFVDRDTQNAEARSQVLDAVRGDEGTVADLVAARQGIVSQARERALANTTPVNSQPLVNAIDEALQAPAAHMEEVARPLQAIRDKIAQAPAETTPAQRAAFQRQVAQSFGADAPALTPEVMSEARTRLGAKFQEVADKTSMKWDNKALSDVVRVISDTAQVVPEGQMPPLFKQLANIASTVKNGENISGASYQALTKKGAPLSSLQQSGDPTIRDAANRIREVLDDALERSVEGEPAGKALLNELRETRLAYKNLKTAEAALKSAGPDKMVTPQAIMSAVKRNFGQFAYKGGGPLGDTAEAALREESARGPRLETDARQLHGMRESLSGAIDKLEAKGGDANHMAADHLRSVRDHLDASIETGAQGYREFVRLSERSAEPIEAARYLQSLKLTDVQGRPSLSRVNSALERIADARARPGKNPAKSVSDATIRQLEALRADLLREKGLDIGKARGSDTVQNIVTGQVANDHGIPLAAGATLAGNPILGAALGAGRAFYGMKRDQILDAVGSRLLNAEAPAAPVVAQAKKGGGAVKRLAAPVLPAAGGVLTSRLVAQ